MSLKHIFADNGSYTPISEATWNAMIDGGSGVNTIIGTVKEIQAFTVGTTTTLSFPTGENNLLLPNNLLTNGNDTSNRTCCIGYSAYPNVQTNCDTIAIGQYALKSISNTTNNAGIAIGNSACVNLSSLGYNVVVGHNSLNDVSNTTSANNVIVGIASGLALQNGSNNIILGNDTAHDNFPPPSTNPSGNIVVGSNSFKINGALYGNSNIIIGDNTCSTADITGNNNIFIGSSLSPSEPTLSNQLVIGNPPILSGTTTQLSVPNFKNIWNTNASVTGQVLSCDTSGNLSWITNSPTPVTPSYALIANFGSLYASGSQDIDFGGSTIVKTSDITVAGPTVTIPANKTFVVVFTLYYTVPDQRALTAVLGTGTVLNGGSIITPSVSITSSVYTSYILSQSVPIDITFTLSGGSSGNLNINGGSSVLIYNI
jgi:hypothetical protein